MSGLDPDCALAFLAVQFEFDNVFRGELQALRHFGTDLHGVVPGELGHRLGKFLKPAVVRELSIPDGGVAANVELDGVGVSGLAFRWRDCRFCGDRSRLERSAVNKAVVQRLPPELLEGSASEASTSRCGLSLPVAANEIVTRGNGNSGG